MWKKKFFDLLVSVIRFTSAEYKVHRLSTEAFNRKHLLISTKDKMMMQERLISFLSLIQSSFLKIDELKRFGSENDGGYVICSIIDKETSVISCGIGNNASFDFQISKEVKDVYMYDHTIETVKNLNANMKFFKVGVDTKSQNSYVSIEEIIEKNRINTSVLKIDIEGMEWNILDSLDLNVLKKFDQIIVEFHNLFEITFQEKSSLYFRVLRNLVSHFSIINVHPNNWSDSRILCGIPFADTLEITFLNKNIKVKNSKKTINLDMPNNSLEPDFLLFRTY
jgi:FkbM family methyltransferase